MRVAVTGVTGRLGAALARVGPRFGWTVLPLSRRELDLARPLEIGERLRRLDFDALVNPAGLTQVDACEERREEAFLVNAEAPARLAEACAVKGAAFLHVSTDYVFSGAEPGLRRETDPAEPVNVYGESKAAGEAAVLGLGQPRFCVARVAWLFGPDGSGFVQSVLARAENEERVELVHDKFSSPTWSDEAVEAFDRLLRLDGPGGLVHVCGTGPASWLDWGREAVEAARETGREFRVREWIPVRLVESAGMRARRPVHTAMACDRLRELTGQQMAPWTESLRRFLRAEGLRMGAAGGSRSPGPDSR